MPAEENTDGGAFQNDLPKKQILLNAFDMSTVGHLSPGQWKVGLTIPNIKFNWNFESPSH